MTGLDSQTYDNAIDEEQTNEHVAFSLICKIRVGKHDISIIAITNDFVDVRWKLVDKWKNGSMQKDKDIC